MSLYLFVVFFSNDLVIDWLLVNLIDVWDIRNIFIIFFANSIFVLNKSYAK